MAQHGDIINPGVHVKNVHVKGGAGSTATVTIAANADEFWAIARIDWSWSATQGGDITVTYGGVTVWEHHAATHGYGYADFKFPTFLHNNFTKNEELKVVMSSAGGSVVPRLTVHYC
jgi:hypothetical protein